MTSAPAPTAPGPALLDVAGLTRDFGGVRAVDDVSFAVHQGDVLGLIGPNGAGKTTVINVVTGYFAPSAGVVRLEGVDTRGMPTHRLAAAGLARTFQHLRLFEGTTVLENVLIGSQLTFEDRRWNLWFERRRQERLHRAHALELLERVGLADHANDSVSGLPYGMRRRVEIARALATRPRLLLLDEPTAGMTRRESDDIGSFVTELNGAGLTIVLVDHNVRLVSNVCHRVAIMDWGRIVMEGTPEQAWADERVKEAYLGSRTEDRGRRASGAGAG
jgi:ABC-type branched-subunit amino acid transport system ATPase component